MHRGGGVVLRAPEQREQREQPIVRVGSLWRGGGWKAVMIVCVALILVLLLARVCLRAKGGKTPLNREELLRMRQYSERIHREEVLPFE